MITEVKTRPSHGAVLLASLRAVPREVNRRVYVRKRGSVISATCRTVTVIIEGFHVTSLQQNLPSHAAHSGHVGSHKIWPNSLLLKLHKA